MPEVGAGDDAKRWFIGLWLGLLALKLVLAVRLPLFVDEAFYWQEGRHLAWAYSDLPGLTAWLARIGDALGDGTLALRLPFLAIAAAIPWLVARMAAREFDSKAGWQAGSLALLLPLAGTLGLLALPDVPLLLATALCLDAGLRLLRRVDAFASMELALGLVVGGLTHYRFAAVIAVGFITLLMLRDGRSALRDPRVWAAVVVGALAWLPLLLWNLHNADAGLRFQLVDRHPWSFSGEGVRLGRMQLLLATPLLLAAMAWAKWRGVRHGNPATRYLAICGAAIVLGFLVLGFFADRERVSFHWPLPGYLALLPLVPAVLARWPRGWRIATWATAAFGLAVVLGYYVVASSPALREQTASRNFYPANFAGWDSVASAVREELRRLPAGTRMLAGDFKLGAQLGFALGDPDMLVLDHPINRRHGRAPQLAEWGLVRVDARDLRRPLLLAVSTDEMRYRHLLSYYHALCAQVGPLPPPRTVWIDHGRRRFQLFTLRRMAAPGVACVAPAMAWIDTPATGETVARRFGVSGWAFKEGVGIASVDVTLNGRTVATARYGSERPHVAAFWKISNDPAHPRVGFDADVAAPANVEGKTWLGLVLHGKDGSVERWPEQRIEIRP